VGRRDRERKQSIIAGQARGIAQARRELMHEVVRRATRVLFETTDPNAFVETMGDSIGEAIVKVLPESLETVGVRTFTLASISKDKDWYELAGRYIAGVLVKCQEKFRHVGKGYWGIRKRPGKLKGRWKYCCWCGGPFYTPLSKCNQRYDSRNCYWEALRRKNVARVPDFAATAAAPEPPGGP